MRLRGIHIRNMGPHEDFSVDFDALGDAKLVAVCGENGSGKTVFLELLTGGALYRECRTRGSLASLATTRDASLEVRLDNGKPWTIRHTVDNLNGKGESIAMDGDGNPVTLTGKVRDFDDWAARTLPLPELLYSSQVIAQKSRGFGDLSPSDRKAVVLRLLRMERLEPMSKSARERSRDADAKAHGIAQSISHFEGASDVENAEGNLGDQMEHEYVKLGAVERAQLALDAARELAGSSALARQRYLELRKSRNDLLCHRDLVHEQFQTTLTTLLNCDVNHAACAKQRADCYDVECDVHLDTATKLAEGLRVKREAVERQIEARWRVEEDLHKRSVERDGLAARIANNRKILDKADEIRAFVRRREEAVAELSGLQLAESHAQLEASAAQLAIELLRADRMIGAEGRIEGLRGGLTAISRHPSNAEAIALETLGDDDEIVADAKAYPSRLKEHEARVSAANAAVRKAQEATVHCSLLASTTHSDEPRLLTTETRIAELEPHLAAATSDVERLRAELAALPVPTPVPADPDLATLRRAAEDAAKRAREAGEELARTEATRVQLEPQVERLRAELTALEGQLEDTPEPVPPEAAPQVEALEIALRDAQRAHQEASAAVGRAQAAVESAQAARAKVVELQGSLADTRAEQADWTRLADDLGRDGLQAALVDSACAQLTALTNDLLHNCLGTRWTVTLDTQRASADGKKLIEGMFVRVIDTKNGRDAMLETLSGGEGALVGEAISLALTAWHCARDGIDGCDLIRDETGSDLTVGMSRAYVAMLRRAAATIGARVILVSHTPEVVELCDARIEIGTSASSVPTTPKEKWISLADVPKTQREKLGIHAGIYRFKGTGVS